jgi:deoxyadenosine/deoxycytidine kinase
MAKKLIFICGPNGVGKSSTGKELINHIKNSAFVDSDLCALRNPFINTEGIDLQKQFMLFMLTEYLKSTIYEFIIWSYGFHAHRKAVFIEIMMELRKLNIEFDFIPIILTCDLDENIRRMKCDNRDEARIDRAVKNTRKMYDDYPFPLINTTNLILKEISYEIIRLIENGQNVFDEKELQPLL